MVGDIKAISPCVKSASAKLFLDLHTVSAPSGEERTLGAAAQVERTGWCCRRFDSGTQTCCGHATLMVLVSSASGPRVSGCTRAPGHFNPYPVCIYIFMHLAAPGPLAKDHHAIHARWPGSQHAPNEVSFWPVHIYFMRLAAHPLYQGS